MVKFGLEVHPGEILREQIETSERVRVAFRPSCHERAPEVDEHMPKSLRHV